MALITDDLPAPVFPTTPITVLVLTACFLRLSIAWIQCSASGLLAILSARGALNVSSSLTLASTDDSSNCGFASFSIADSWKYCCPPASTFATAFSVTLLSDGEKTARSLDVDSAFTDGGPADERVNCERSDSSNRSQ